VYTSTTWFAPEVRKATMLGPAASALELPGAQSVRIKMAKTIRMPRMAALL
jgi:hypothetical protein